MDWPSFVRGWTIRIHWPKNGLKNLMDIGLLMQQELLTKFPGYISNRVKSGGSISGGGKSIVNKSGS
ncbi:MAG: hypothetical protein JWQ49_2377 [Edaphobacter sp.]|nr:hypothetical protein [Edaphobacter sp.]